MENGTSIESTCLQVFAKASAAISHEIKNTLSIINENAGLLDDLAAMAEQGEGVAAERVRAAAATIMKQVDRSNLIMKNLNRFAHSADTPLATANLSETLDLVVALTARQAAMKMIKVAVSCPPDLVITTCLLSFESLLYQIFCQLYSSSASSSSIELRAVAGQQGVTLQFEVQKQPGAAGSLRLDDCALLLKQLHMQEAVTESGLHLTFPAEIG